MSQQSESVLNSVLIDMSRSFLQYIAECWPWVDVVEHAQSVERQVMVIAARQRQDVADIASLLTSREHVIDFGTFPTDYTDLQFLALDGVFDNLNRSQELDRLPLELQASISARLQQAIELLDASAQQAVEFLPPV